MSKRIDLHLIGKSIKSLRQSRSWTQEYLADTVGYSVRNLRRIENDGTGSIDVVNTFADIFGVSALDILNGCFLFVHVLTNNDKIDTGFKILEGDLNENNIYGL